MENASIVFPAEWSEQSGVQLTWPHEGTDWNYMLERVQKCYVNVAREIAKREKLLIVCQDENKVRELLGDVDMANVIFREVPSNDTWARDHGAITVFVEGVPYLYDFTFNGWGMKFASNHDNQITRELYVTETFREDVAYMNLLHFVLEGGSVESDGKGTIMTTSECLLSPNRNDHFEKEELEAFLMSVFGAERMLWINNGYLAGDDTDSHVDTLARFCDEKTIAYVKCDDENDEHYDALKAMEEEIKTFRTRDGEPYRLVPLPMADCVEEDGERLPATYANFLIVNGAVLVPTYNSEKKDAEALAQIKVAFPDREVVGIDCSALICQHGSLHCITMQFPKGVL